MAHVYSGKGTVFSVITSKVHGGKKGEKESIR
jgi:hypothetical protein